MWLLSIDTPAENKVSTAGWALGHYGNDEHYSLAKSGIIDGGLYGYLDWLRQVPLFGWSRLVETVVVEKFVPFKKHGDSSPLLAEGATIAWAEHNGFKLVRQAAAGKNTAVPDYVLKNLGLYSLTGHHHDEREAVRHALYYLFKQRHKPTLRAMHNEN